MATNPTTRDRTARVKIVLWTSKTHADGSHPFVVRIYKDGTRKHITTGLTLHPQYWNAKKNEIRKSYPSDKRRELEENLRKWHDKFVDAADKLLQSDTRHNAEAVVDVVADERQATRKFKLLEYFTELIHQFEKTGKVGNRKVYRDVQCNLARFMGAEEQIKTDTATNTKKGIWSKDVPFNDVTVKFCNEWEAKMREEGLTDVTLSVKFRTLRAVLNKAIGNGYAKTDNYPFARNTAEIYKFQVGKFKLKTKKRAISKADIRKIEAYQPEPYTGPYASLRDPTDRLLLARDLFCFSYYCGGINFVDMAALQWKNIANDHHGNPRLTYTRRKTGGEFSITLKPVVLAILERYKSDTVYPGSYIFPILNTALHKTASQIHNRCSKIMGQVNTDLKTIGQAVGIDAPLTTYVARHSFATALRSSGTDIAVISAAMGHKDEATTNIYLSEFDTSLVDAAYDNL